VADPMGGLPTDPISDFAMGAAASHELFLSYVGAGFTEEQALSILLAILSETIRQAHRG
jgi:hypothetical protein